MNTTATNKAQQMIKKVLSHFNDSREAQHYLKRYHDDEQKFAVVKVGGGIIADELNSLTESLAILSQMGLTPIIIHGGGPQIDRAMAEVGISSVKKDGLRVTSSRQMRLIDQLMSKINALVVDSLKKWSVPAQSFTHGVFACQLIDQSKYGSVGEVIALELAAVKKCLAQGVVPVLSCLGYIPESSQAVNINADTATRALVAAIKPHKTLFVTPTGGLLNEKNQVISAIQLRHDYDHLMSQKWLHSGMKLKLQQINRLLEMMDSSHSVSITSCQNLVKELFTHKGAGTYISLGEKISCNSDSDQIDWLELSGILECSFGRQLKVDWWQDLTLLNVFIAESGRAAAVVCKGHDNVPYLDKFAVTPEAQGEGLAASLWQEIIKNHPSLYWRSRYNNEINPWYHKKADFSVKQEQGDWIGFACGLTAAVATACTAQAFLIDPGWCDTIQEVQHA
ncbi:acetylglutamate kinase [Marinicella rhabdoformis]|uniref:acetylglutamate kinase n=1 Tax=Marinicella rhabdoformis TaxID=2580566 RepID=UPI0012AEE051|nr:acetylglutamate kinase [Marinicella rhabdoformis]